MRRRTVLGAAAAAAASLPGCAPERLLDALVAPGAVERREGVPYGAGPRRTLDVFKPEAPAGPQPLPVIVFLYGGNWRTGDKDNYAFMGRELAKRGAVVVVPDYRLFPETAFPGFLQDCAAAVAWAVRNAAAEGGDPRSVFVVGHSAGAYNAAMLALDGRFLAREGLSRRALAGVVGLAGPYDFLPITRDDIKPVFAPAGAPAGDGPATQPITYADGTNPPLLLLAGEADETVEPRNTVALAARIRARGGPVESRLYPGVGHIGILLAFTPMFRGKAPAEEDVWAFVQRRRGGGRPPGSMPGSMPGSSSG